MVARKELEREQRRTARRRALVVEPASQQLLLRAPAELADRAERDGTLPEVGAAGRGLVASMIGLPTTSWRALGSLANCCWSVVGETDTGWRLFDHNAGSLPERVVGDDR